MGEKKVPKNSFYLGSGLGKNHETSSVLLGRLETAPKTNNFEKAFNKGVGRAPSSFSAPESEGKEGEVYEARGNTAAKRRGRHFIESWALKRETWD